MGNYLPQVQTEYDKYEARLGKALDHFKSEMISVRAGRANPQILNKIVVDYYGTPTPLNQMANISVPEARVLTISLWDVSMVKAVSKAIAASDIGINPSDDGKIIRLVFPQLTEERRKELGKQIKKTCEDTKVVLRNERRDMIEALKRLKKDNVITEDEQKTAENELQKVTDSHIKELDTIGANKEKEIMAV